MTVKKHEHLRLKLYDVIVWFGTFIRVKFSVQPARVKWIECKWLNERQASATEVRCVHENPFIFRPYFIRILVTWSFFLTFYDIMEERNRQTVLWK